MVSLPESSWAEPGESLHTTPYLMAGETEVLRAKTKVIQRVEAGGVPARWEEGRPGACVAAPGLSPT